MLHCNGLSPSLLCRDMAAAQKELRRAILAVLPDLPADTLTTLMAGLGELGVENKENMNRLSEENVVQSRKLLRAFSSQGNLMI